MALSNLENLPLPDRLNLPQDLRELKRKIEATEHKVEGTKHRHRKGGPCPRRQVKNQLRAAKRAYHKRAVAHKKLPHVVVNSVNDEALGPDASRGVGKKSMACFQDVDVPSFMQATDEWVPQMARKLKARIHGVNAHHNIAGEKESEVVKAGRCMFDSLATVWLRTQGSRRMRARCLWLSSENVSLGSVPVTLSSQQGDRLLRGSSSNS
ncbi:hypothetical protein PsorP6_017152 [Peronosclerospora sorghi]|uniref:Uncharacterized protein n=1 Tax=Peronosclerospora sorghi TaxID=230839 RepID=A0ACC0WED2_9STRA|nr:hypothetical protein PsorP6_017152 [Peronosclerospora sorghi]